jgi:hypothetical protein
MEVSGQLHAPAALPPGKDLLYPWDRRLGGPQSRAGYEIMEYWPLNFRQAFRYTKLQAHRK